MAPPHAQNDRRACRGPNPRSVCAMRSRQSAEHKEMKNCWAHSSRVGASFSSVGNPVPITAHLLQINSKPLSRIVKIFALDFLLEVTLLPSPVLWLVFRFTLTHTQRP